MKLLFHFINLTIWLLIPCAFVFILSFPFGYSYWNAVQSSVFIVVYFIYTICMIVGYPISTDEPDQPLSFIKTNNL